MTMLHEVGVDLGTQLAARNCPILVEDGPQRRTPTTYARERIVIEDDPDFRDSFESRHRADTRPPRTLLTRLQACKITIYAKCPSKGALEWEHKRRAEIILDMVLVGLFKVAKIRQNQWNPRSGRFVYPDDLKQGETMGGAVYELYGTFDRGVADRNWDGSADTTVAISPQMVGGPALTFSATAHTITRSFGSWITDGFAVGNVVIVSGSQLNNGTMSAITALTDTVMTFGAGLVNEGPSSGVTVTGNGVVIQNASNVSGFTADGGTSTEGA